VPVESRMCELRVGCDQSGMVAVSNDGKITCKRKRDTHICGLPGRHFNISESKNQTVSITVLHRFRDDADEPKSSTTEFYTLYTFSKNFLQMTAVCNKYNNTDDSGLKWI